MILTRKIKMAALALTALTVIGAGTEAQAQTVGMTVAGSVLNSMTVTATTQLNFGTVAAVGHGTDLATFNIATDGTYTTTNTANAYIFAVDDTAVSQGTITVADASGTINIDIQTVSTIAEASHNFAILAADWTTSYGGAADASRTAGTPWTETFVGPTDTLLIGAEIGTVTGVVGAYNDGAYAGTYNVVFSY